MTAPRLDAERLVQRITTESGIRLELEGFAEHGESGGAAYVRWPDGRPAVLTETRSAPAGVRRVGEVLDLVAARGIPVPRYLLVTGVGETTVVVQERLPGRLDAVLDGLPSDVLRRYWAHMSLRMVDWTIRHHGPADVAHQLAFAATRLETLPRVARPEPRDSAQRRPAR